MRINDLVGIATKSGLSRANRFQVSIPKFNSDEQYANIMAESVVLPGRTMTTQEYTNERETIKYVYGFIDDEITMTFLLDGKYKIRALFDAWMKEIVDTETYTLGYKNNYAKDVSIYQLGKDDAQVYGVKLIKAYPTIISSTELGSTNEDISRMTVTFSYERFQIL